MELELPLFGQIPLGMKDNVNITSTAVRPGATASGSTFKGRGPITPVPPPPKADKGRHKKTYCQPTIENLEEDDETPQPPNHPQDLPQNQPQYHPHYQERHQQGTLFPHGLTPRIQQRYGVPDDSEKDSPPPRERYERDAILFGVSNYEMAIQIGVFVKTEELNLELKAMDGYKEVKWNRLRRAMVETWGERDNTILHTPKELVKLSHTISKKGGLSSFQEYKIYLGKFSTILNYLIKNKQLRDKQDASYQFLADFSLASQKNIKRTLSQYNNVKFFLKRFWLMFLY
ncbi:hypothetical protein PCANC_20101 [Puccinia coronata f. sp. avenae]|uniref:Uncharacterized protein n=1 Tax=Puccinia coronata f. sp. avenae TaxID=200324 RepID=A0A2N5TZE4_9BASI|nr:hypothetical protein PCANC_20101 [Puccinia coronata f. sp. avenae]